MEYVDWALILGLNGSIIAYALWRPATIRTTADWFLANRNLPWWVVGLSAFATAIDSSDLVADSGGVYKFGMTYFVTNWVGTVAGWVLLAHFVIKPMYRAGMYTNAEYLEARFGPATRAISVLVQVQYRLVVMGIMAATMYLTFRVVGGLHGGAWWAVGVFVVLAAAYTIRGGSGAVAWTDTIQSVVMIAASVVFFVLVWRAVGGFAGVDERLRQTSDELARQMLHIGNDEVMVVDAQAAGMTEQRIARELLLGGEYDPDRGTITRRTPAWLVCVGFILVGLAYAIVNHEQTMRLFGARSEWDLQLGVVAAGGLLILATFLNLGMGILGRGLYPDPEALPVSTEILTKTDTIYPTLIREYAPVGMRGLIVAGLLAAALSTYTGTSSALASLLTRDVYGRLLVRDREDAHYLHVGRWLTLIVIAASFAFVPAVLRQGMLDFYLDIVGAFVVPLLTIYLMGTFTRVHRRSGAIGLAAGVIYGVARLLAGTIAVQWGVAILPTWLISRPAGYLASVAFTAAAMIVTSLVCGWQRPGDLLHAETSPWLRRSQLAAADIGEAAPGGVPWLPAVLGLVVIAVGSYLSFVVFW